MAETENRYTRIARKVADQILAKAEALAETMEVPLGMERIRDRQAYLARYQAMSPLERLQEEARVGEDKLAALIRGGEVNDNT